MAVWCGSSLLARQVGTDIDVRIAARLGGKHVGATVSLGLSSVSFEATLRVKVALCKRAPYVRTLDIEPS